MGNTIYETTFKYITDDKATSGMLGLAASAGKAERAALSLKTAIMGIGTGLLFQAAKKHFVDFNASMETANNTINTVLMSTYKVSYDQAKSYGKATLDELLNYSKKAPGAFEDYIEGFAKITAAARGVKAPLSEMTTVTEKLVAISQSGLFHGQETTLVQEVAKFLGGGQIVHKGPVPLLVSMMGSTIEQVRKMNQQERYEWLKAGENSAAFQRSILEGGKSFTNVWKSLHNNIDIMLGKVGLPFFKTITAEIIRWNEWFEKNNALVEQFAKTMADKVVSAFHIVKDAVGFIVDHKTALIAIAGAYAGIKGGVSFMGAGLSVAKATAGMAGVEALGGTVAAVLGTAGVIAAVAALSIAVGAYLGAPTDQERRNKAFNQQQADFIGFAQRMFVGADDASGPVGKRKQMQADLAYNKAHHLTGGVTVLEQKLAENQTQINRLLQPTVDWLRTSNAVSFDKKGVAHLNEDQVLKSARAGIGPFTSKFAEDTALNAARKAFALADPKSFKDLIGQVSPQDINANIVIHVASEDPDRFAMNFKKIITNVIRRPTISRSAWRDGL